MCPSSIIFSFCIVLRYLTSLLFNNHINLAFHKTLDLLYLQSEAFNSNFIMNLDWAIGVPYYFKNNNKPQELGFCLIVSTGI